MSGEAVLTFQCWCTPPKTMTADSQHQTARCEDCGIEVLVGILDHGPRLKLVDGDA